MHLQSVDCDETASTVSGSDHSDAESVSSWGSLLSEADPEILDPVLSVPIPPKSASSAEIAQAHRAHLLAAGHTFQSLTAPPPPPDEVVRCIERIASAGPTVTLRKRRAFLSDLKAMAISLRPESDRLLASSPAHVPAVNPRAHPALLQWCLDRLPSSDQTLVQHVVDGFPLVGHIPIDPRARAKEVRKMKISPSELRSRAAVIAKQSIHKHLSRRSPSTMWRSCSRLSLRLASIACSCHASWKAHRCRTS